MFTLPPLPYPYDALEPYIDVATMKVHHDGHEATYVNNLNEALKDFPKFSGMSIEDLMRSINQVPEEIKTKVINNGGGVVNHNLFWTIMSPDGGKEPNGNFSEAINQDFASFNNFKDQFSNAAAGIFGSGYVFLVVNNQGKLEIMSTHNQSTPLSEGKTPILNLDVWEHAYYLKYQNKRKDYISAWWNVVNYQEVEKRLLEARNSLKKS